MSTPLIIFDTTLRDGEQSPGAAMSLDTKMRIARQLELLGVDVIEAGFPAASEGDFLAVQAVAQTLKKSTVCALSRAIENDIRRAGEAIQRSPFKRIHTFIASSPIHMKHKLGMNEDQVVERAIQAVQWAREYTEDVEFSAEDASRSDFDFLVRLFTAAIKAGACTLNVPDTVGYATPEVWGELFFRLIKAVPGSEKVVWSTHCHNDLGMAVANSLAAVQGGARQVECTINGLGERAGNAALEEIVMALQTRQDIYPWHTRIDARQLVPSSQLVSLLTGYSVQPNKAIVGANAFTHESGIHQDGVLKHRETYEIMQAETVGWKSNQITLSKLSGRNALRQRYADLHITFATEEEFQDLFTRFKRLADQKREIFDEDLQSLLTSHQSNGVETDFYRLLFLSVHTETGQSPKALVRVTKGSDELQGEAIGDGAVDAALQAVENIIQSGAELKLYSVNNITQGTDAQGEVMIRLFQNGRLADGHGADPDILVASVKAYLQALNRLHQPGRKHPQPGV